jgi:hypothetical protein
MHDLVKKQARNLVNSSIGALHCLIYTSAINIVYQF